MKNLFLAAIFACTVSGTMQASTEVSTLRRSMQHVQALSAKGTAAAKAFAKKTVQGLKNNKLKVLGIVAVAGGAYVVTCALQDDAWTTEWAKQAWSDIEWQAFFTALDNVRLTWQTNVGTALEDVQQWTVSHLQASNGSSSPSATVSFTVSPTSWPTDKPTATPWHTPSPAAA